MNWIIFTSFIGFSGLVALGTWLMVRKKETNSQDGYFLAGRSLTFPVIAGSLLLTNLSTEQLVGLNGSAYAEGFIVMAWELVAVVALICMALFFLPRFLRTGITTIPEYLSLRFDRTTGAITNIIFLCAYTFGLLPIILYTGATGMNGIFNLQNLIGPENKVILLWAMVWFIGIAGAIYALFGGLRSVAVSDTLNGIGLLTGGFMIVYFALNTVSDGAGVVEGVRILHKALPEKFNSIGSSQSSVPFPTLFTGVLIINVFYWCTNQQIIQRTLGASSLAEGQKGVLLTGALKILGPLYLVLPGVAAYYLFSKQGIRPDHAYGTLVYRVLPAPLTGFFAAVLVGAILSSFNSALNSTCTLFSLGIYKEFIRRDATEEQVVRSGKIFGWIVAVAAMSVAPLLDGTTSIFTYLQHLNSLYFIPIFAVVIIAMLTRVVPPFAANFSLIAGCVLMLLSLFVNIPIQQFHYACIVFVFLIVFMLFAGLFKPLAQPRTVPDANVIDLTPWKPAPYVAAVIFLIVVTIYAVLAKF